MTAISNLEDKILALIPTSPSKACTSALIYTKLLDDNVAVGLASVKTTVKDLRKKGYPILWNIRGIYISYDRDLIQKQIKMIESMKYGFTRGMSNIQEVLKESIV